MFILAGLQDRAAARQTANNIIDCIRRALLENPHTTGIGTSIGIALYPSDRSEAALLIKAADDAMYLAKQQGKNRFAFASELH